MHEYITERSTVKHICLHIANAVAPLHSSVSEKERKKEKIGKSEKEYLNT